MAKEQITRQEVPEALTWDLTPIFQSDAEQEAAVADILQSIPQLTALQGTLGDSSQALLTAIQTSEDLDRRLYKAYAYAHLKNDQDQSNSTYQTMYQKTYAAYVRLAEAQAFLEPEILVLPEELVRQFVAENDQLQVYGHMLDRLLSKKAHVLSEQEERLLSGAAELFAAPGETASALSNADMQFPKTLGVDGEEVRLTHGLYTRLLESSDPEVRRQAYAAMYDTFKGLKFTFASTLSATVKSHNFNAKVRHYQSARQAAMANNHVPEAVYDTLLTVVKERLPLLHRYMELRKRVLGLEEMHMYDLYTPIVGDAPISFTIEEAKEITLKALAPLGESYQALLRRAFDERWIDWPENRGKRSGAYSSGMYDTRPYILMNWYDSINHLYTLVHELGHSLHSQHTFDNQPYVYGNYPIFLAEIASTTNENLLTEYLLQTTEDPRVKQYVLNHYLDGVKGTIFRQTQFAEFEHLMHQLDAQGVPLTQETLSSEYGKMNAAYYGPAVTQDEAIAYEWARIPHFYYNYYVFQYATGFAAASALAERILNEGEPAVERYLDYLKAGSSDYPIDVMKRAGVDMTEATYLHEALDLFEQRLNELEQLLSEQ